ncbi:MAG: LamG domain-containing protein [Phycisphaerae bacterium]|jgi:hypothetical protein
MCRKPILFIIVSIALQLVLAANIFAAAPDMWWKGADESPAPVSSLWTEPANWWYDGAIGGGTATSPPREVNDVHMSTLPAYCTLNSSCNPDPNFHICRDLFVGDWAPDVPGIATLDIDGETLNVVRTLTIGAKDTTWNTNKATGDVNVINGGIINVGGDLWVGSEGIGYLNVRDGDVNVIGTLRCPGGLQPSYTGQQAGTHGSGYINLYNGTIAANDIYCQTGDTTLINIAGGTLILNGNKVTAINNLMGESKVLAYSGLGEIQCDYDVRNAGKTTVTGLPGDPNYASLPSPGNYAQEVALDVNLYWTKGVSAASHDVYLGTTFSDVNTADHTTPAGIFKGNYAVAAYDPPSALSALKTYYWRIDEVNTVTYKGKIWRFTVMDPNIAWAPVPVNNAENVVANATLAWSKGISANAHNVYLGTSLSDVNNADTSTAGIYRGRVTTLSYNPGELLLGTKRYYWRIDEVNTISSEPNLWKGRIWTFTTADYKLIDNFDGYYPTGGSTHPWITDAWKVAGGASISTATLFSDGETATLDYNAMQINYNNGSSPWYSEVNYPLPTTGDKRNWIRGGVALLGISLHGEPTNQVERLYVTVKDFNNHSVTVNYPDSNGVVQQLNEYWSWWLIDVKKFSDGGVYLGKVKNLKIGLGDKVSPGGSGILYVDNISLYPRWCPTGFNISLDQNADADFNNDCMVNMDDFVILVDSWLDSDYQVTAAAPPTSDPNLLIWYKFDETGGAVAYDSSSNGYDGYLIFDGDFVAGYSGNALVFDGAYQYLTLDPIPNAVKDVNLGGRSTIALWLKDNGHAAGEQIFQIGSGSGNLQIWSEWTGDLQYTCGIYPNTYQDQLFWGRYGFTNPLHVLNEWEHYAFTKDYTTGIMRIYRNGYAVAEYADANAPVMRAVGTGYFTIGAWRYEDSEGGYFAGAMDDFRLYNRALSDAEILSLAGGSSITQPVLSQANAVADDQVNFEDFAVMAARWMENPLLWP